MTFVRDLLVVLAVALAWAGPLSPAVAAEPKTETMTITTNRTIAMAAA